MDKTRYFKRALPGAAGQTLRALRHRNYRLFFFGQLVSLIGSWMQSLAQGWLVWRLTHSAWLLGVLGFAQSVPVLFVGLLGGEAADRFERHKLIIATQAAALVQATALTILTISGRIQVWQIVVLAGLLGVINAFDMPVRQAFVVQMVGREDLGNAIALNSSVFNGARIVGPALAGLVVSKWGEGVCFGVNAASFLAVLAALLAMRLEKRPIQPVTGGPWQRLKEGFGYAWRTQHVRALLGLLSITGLVALPYASLLPAFVGGVLKGGASGLGILMACAGVGAVTGALVMAYRKGIRGLGRRTAYMAMGFGTALVLFSLSESFALSCGILGMLGFCVMSEIACINTLLQSLVPEEMRGRLMSLYVIMFMGTAPIGSLIEGKLAALYGLRPIVLVSGLVTLIAGFVFRLAVPRMRASVQPLLSNLPGGMV